MGLQQLLALKNDPRNAPTQAETYPLTGDVAHLEPLKALDEVRAKIGAGARLYTMEASFVRSDGTMDLTATYDPGPHIKYKFYRQAEGAPTSAAPVGAGRRPDDVWVEAAEVEVYKPGAMRNVTRLGGRTNSSVHYENKGMDITRHAPSMSRLDPDLGPPKISCADLWKIALTKGAPKDAVATITYNMNGYHFVIDGTPANLYFDFDGKLKR